MVRTMKMPLLRVIRQRLVSVCVVAITVAGWAAIPNAQQPMGPRDSGTRPLAQT